MHECTVVTKRILFYSTGRHVDEVGRLLWNTPEKLRVQHFYLQLQKLRVGSFFFDHLNTQTQVL